MKSSKTQQTSDAQAFRFSFGNLLLPGISLFALAATFLAASSDFRIEKKLFIFFLIIFFYILFCAAHYFWQKNKNIPFENEKDTGNVFSEEVEKQLLALDEASQFFGASLKSADMLRLASSRVREIIPHSLSVLLLVEDGEDQLQLAGANGVNSREILAPGKIPRKGLAALCLSSRKIETDEGLRFEKNVFSPEVLKGLKSAIAVPLFENSGKIFGIFTLYGAQGEIFEAQTAQILEAAGKRIAPLILSSLAFERNVSNALTDSLTNLPNGRAFYLILENQIAESQRRRAERPLAILAIDIKNFNELNQKYGHTFGDRILTFTAGVIGSQLRKMDFLARSEGDEFLVVLPTAKEATAHEIIARIERAFQTTPFETAPGQKQYLQVNPGMAIFWKDGETAEEMLKTARLKKNTAKSGTEAKIIWFPKEFVN